MHIDLNKLASQIDGLQNTFGDDLQMAKMIVETQDIDSSALIVTQEQGLILYIANLYKIINPF